MNNRDTLVTKVKELVDSGLFKPGQVLTARDIYQQTPEIYRGSAGVIISMMCKAGLLTNLGRNQIEIAQEIADTPLQDCLELVRMAEQTRGEGGIKRNRSRKVREPEPEEPEQEEFVSVNFIELLNQLSDEEIPQVIDACVQTMLNRMAEMGQHSNAHNRDLRREVEALLLDVERYRKELKDEKERTMELRTEIGKLRSYPKAAIADRTVLVANKPIPEGGQSGGSGGFAKGGMVVHRKPLMGHTPKIIRQHTVKE